MKIHVCTRKKIKQWWSTIPATSPNRTKTSHLKSLNTKRNMTYDVGNPDPDLEQAHNYGGVKPVNVIPTHPSIFKVFLKGCSGAFQIIPQRLFFIFIPRISKLWPMKIKFFYDNWENN